jgi:hypothetical protein
LLPAELDALVAEFELPRRAGKSDRAKEVCKPLETIPRKIGREMGQRFFRATRSLVKIESRAAEEAV